MKSQRFSSVLSVLLLLLAAPLALGEVPENHSNCQPSLWKTFTSLLKLSPEKKDLPFLSTGSFLELAQKVDIRDRALISELFKTRLLETPLALLKAPENGAVHLKTFNEDHEFSIIERNPKDMLIQVASRQYRITTPFNETFLKSLLQDQAQNQNFSKPVPIPKSTESEIVDITPLYFQNRIIGHHYRLITKNPELTRLNRFYDLVKFHKTLANKLGIKFEKSSKKKKALELYSPSIFRAMILTLKTQKDPSVSFFTPKITSKGKALTDHEFLEFLAGGMVPIEIKSRYLFEHDYLYHWPMITTIQPIIGQEAVMAAKTILGLQEKLSKTSAGKRCFELLEKFIGTYFDFATASLQIETGEHLRDLGYIRRNLSTLLHTMATSTAHTLFLLEGTISQLALQKTSQTFLLHNENLSASEKQILKTTAEELQANVISIEALQEAVKSYRKNRTK